MKTPENKTDILGVPEPTSDEQFLEQSTAKAKEPVYPAPVTATRAAQPHVPKDGSDGSIVNGPIN